MRRLAVLGVAVVLIGLSGCMLFSSGDVVYDETFSGSTNAAWHLGSTQAADKWIDNGKYYMLVKQAIMGLAYNQVAGPFADVQIDLDVDHILGTPDKSAAGLLFRIVDSENMYAFLVSAAGTFSVGKWVGGTWTTLIAWTDSTAVNQGTLRNHLTVIADGPSLTFLVNKTEVTMLTDSSFASGRVGVTARAFDSSVDVLEAFDNLVVQNIRK